MANEAELEQAFETLRTGLEQKIESRQKKLARLRLEIQEKLKQEDEYVREVTEMEMALGVFQRQLGLGVAAPSLNGFDSIRFRSQTVAESAKSIMEMMGGGAKVVEILHILLDAKKLKNYKSGYVTVKKTLERDKRFKKVGVGQFELA